MSSGFDAAQGDELGENLVTPGGFAHMTSQLQPIAGGKIVVVLEVSCGIAMSSHTNLTGIFSGGICP